MSIIFDGQRIETPGLETVSHLDNPKVPRATDFNTRRKPIVALMFHTVSGLRGPLLPGGVPSQRAEAFAQYQAATARNVSWDYTVDRDGTVVVSNDPVKRYTWHAGPPVVNSQSIGVEAVQEKPSGAQYQATIDAEVALAELLCERFPTIPRRTPVNPDGTPFTGLLDDQLFHGVYGHRNVWRLNDAGKRETMKPFGDPNDHIFLALLAAGFEPVVIDARGRPT